MAIAIKDRIREPDVWTIQKVLRESGFQGFYNEYAPNSYFWVKHVGSNTVYIRQDYDFYRGYKTYMFESWIRDETKNILDKDVDSQKTWYKEINQAGLLLSFIAEYAA